MHTVNALKEHVEIQNRVILGPADDLPDRCHSQTLGLSESLSKKMEIAFDILLIIITFDRFNVMKLLSFEPPLQFNDDSFMTTS